MDELAQKVYICWEGEGMFSILHRIHSKGALKGILRQNETSALIFPSYYLHSRVFLFGFNEKKLHEYRKTSH